jgi:hypothetical protein
MVNDQRECLYVGQAGTSDGGVEQDFTCSSGGQGNSEWDQGGLIWTSVQGDNPQLHDCGCICQVIIDCGGVCGGGHEEIECRVDNDGDGLGDPGTEFLICVDPADEFANSCQLNDATWYPTAGGGSTEDPWPGCPTNDPDECGVCAGDNWFRYETAGGNYDIGEPACVSGTGGEVIGGQITSFCIQPDGWCDCAHVVELAEGANQDTGNPGNRDFCATTIFI